MKIRPAAESDWPRVGELAEGLVRTHYAFDRSRFVHPDTLRASDYVERLRAEVDEGGAMVQVADANGVVAGYVFASIEPENWKELRHEAGYVHDLVVGEPFRQAGVGRALLASAIEWFAARRISRVMLWAASANADAQHLFRRMGFRDTMVEMTLER